MTSKILAPIRMELQNPSVLLERYGENLVQITRDNRFSDEVTLSGIIEIPQKHWKDLAYFFTKISEEGANL